MNEHFDIIGDIHGYLGKLVELLTTLGYREKDGYFQHPERRVLFVGDYIDRGPDNPGVVRLVRAMVDNDAAIALMGNHEYNAILYNEADGDTYLRPHSSKNIHQHAVTLDQYRNIPEQYISDIEWFKSLPFFYESSSLRACHASWDKDSIQYLKTISDNGVLSTDLLRLSAQPEQTLFYALESICKGIEEPLPHGVVFSDKDGNDRSDIRIKWWVNPNGKSYKDLSVVPIEMQDTPFNGDFDHYLEHEVPVFFGHYWMKGKPAILKHNVCCLDYSVAKNGYIVAYRFDGEQKLSNQKIVYI